MRVILIIDEAPHYLGCFNSEVIVPPRGEYIKYCTKMYKVTHVVYDTDVEEINVFVREGV